MQLLWTFVNRVNQFCDGVKMDMQLGYCFHAVTVILAIEMSQRGCCVLSLSKRWLCDIQEETALVWIPLSNQCSLLQYSCLENPRDGGAWWAAVYGVAQSQTRLKRLSSGSSSKPALIIAAILIIVNDCFWLARLKKNFPQQKKSQLFWFLI